MFPAGQNFNKVTDVYRTRMHVRSFNTVHIAVEVFCLGDTTVMINLHVLKV